MNASTPADRKMGQRAQRANTLSLRQQAVLWDKEEHFWTSGIDNLRATTLPNAVMIFPYPAGILQGKETWAGLRDRTGWRTVAMVERHVTRCGDIAILSYRVLAEKSGAPIYKALCASTYLREEERWLRVSHQQTPAA